MFEFFTHCYYLFQTESRYFLKFLGGLFTRCVWIPKKHSAASTRYVHTFHFYSKNISLRLFLGPDAILSLRIHYTTLQNGDDDEEDDDDDGGGDHIDAAHIFFPHPYPCTGWNADAVVRKKSMCQKCVCVCVPQCVISSHLIYIQCRW